MSLKRRRSRVSCWSCAIATLLLFAGCGRSDEVPQARFVRQIDWMERGEWLKVELQSHTKFGEGGRSVEEVVSKAVHFDCDAIAITDNADHLHDSFKSEHWEKIRQARERHKGLLIIGGLEWNLPPFGRDARAVVLLPEEGNEFVTLSEFKAGFDDAGLSTHDPQRARDALEWLAKRGSGLSVPPVLLYVDPSRNVSSADKTVDRMRHWRSINGLFAGVTGAPGDQASTNVGDYTGPLPTIDRWDPAVAELGGAWDQLLQKNSDVWGASATSDFRRDPALPDGEDYWPGEFAETWVYAPERSSSGILKAVKAGSYFGVHGKIAREVELTATLPGLPRRAYAGERIEVTPGSQVMLSINGRVDEKDWAGNPNRIDTIEFIISSAEGTRDIVKPVSASAAFIVQQSVTIPADGCVVRARGRKINPDGDDLLFYTNPIRISVRHGDSLPDDEPDAPTLESPQQRWFALIGVAGLIVVSAASLWTFKTLIGNGPSVAGPYRRASSGMKRRWYLRSGMLWFVMMFYSSLAPFRFHARSWREVLGDLESINWYWPAAADRTILWIHFWLALVLSFLWLGGLIAEHRRWGVRLTTAVGVLVLGLCAVGAWEFLTAMLLGQKLSHLKLIAAGAGCTIGIIAWLAGGERLHRRLNEYLGVSNRRRQTDMLLIAYMAGFAICSVMPFDLLIMPEDLNLKFEARRIVMIPFGNESRAFQSLLISILSFVPVGVCMSRIGMGMSGRLRSFLPSLAFAAMFAVAVEFGRFLAFSRIADTTYILTHIIGALIGVAIVRFPGSDEHKLLSYYAEKYQLGPYLHWKVAAVAYVLLLCFVYWWPFAVLGNSSVIAQRFGRFVHWPFSVWQHSAEPNPIAKLMMFVPLGMMLSQIVGDPSLPARLRKKLERIALVLAFLFGLGLEAVQGVLPPNVPDVTDALLYGGGTLLGMAVMSKWLRSST
ncbi:MAG: VanZ family protein [Planctomycetaceae bacterium]